MKLPRYYPILDTATLEARRFELFEAAEGMLEGGATIVQLRHKGQWTRSLFDQALRLAELCRESSALLVINDRADVAALAGAGLHLGQDDLTPEIARRVLGDALPIGYSTHNHEQFAAALTQPIQYVATGPIFSTVSKDRPDPVVGTEFLASIRQLTSLPLVAIGGISRTTARSVWDAGADTLAVIGDALPQDGGRRAVRERTAEWVALAGS